MESEATWVDFLTVQSSLTNATFCCIGRTSKNVRCRRPIGLQSRNDVRTTLEPWDNSIPPAKELEDVLSKLLCPSHQSKKLQDEYRRRWTDESAVHDHRRIFTPPARSHLVIPQIDRSRAGSAPPDLDPSFVDGFKCGISSCKSAITSLEDSFGRLAIARTLRQNEESAILEDPSGLPEKENMVGQTLSDEDSSDSSDAEFMSAISSPSRPPPHWRAQTHVTPYTALLTASRTNARAPAAARSSPARLTAPAEPPQPPQPVFQVSAITDSPPRRLSHVSIKKLETKLRHTLRKPQPENEKLKFVYVLTATEVPGLVKVGVAKDMQKRQDGLASKCKIKDIQVHYMSRPVNHAGLVEKLAHHVLKAWGFDMEVRCLAEGSGHREWFSCNKEAAIEVVKLWSEIGENYHRGYPDSQFLDVLGDFHENGGPEEGYETLDEMIKRHDYWFWEDG